ncbi:MAG TPA: biotin/lipoyl-binding protein [Pseudomonadales bacterium]
MSPFSSLSSRLWPRSPRGKHIAAAAAILGAATLSSVSIFATGPAPEPQVPPEKAWPVAVVAAQPESLSPSFTAFGRVESSRVAELGTDLIAPVARVEVHEGDWVQAGDLLVELDDREVALALAEREADLAREQALLQSIVSEREPLERTVREARSMHEIARDKLARHRELMTARLISQSLLDEVVAEANRAAITLENHERQLSDLPNRLAAQQAVVEKARVLVERARLEVAKTRVTAPFDGPVLAVHVAPGDRTRPGETLLEMADAAAFEVRVPVPPGYERRFQRHPGGTGEIQALLADGRRLDLARLAHQVRPGRSGLDAFFRLPATGSAPLPPLGRVVDLQVRLPEEPDVVALPIASLYENDRVYAVEDRRLRAITVERVGELHTPDGEYRVLVRSPELAGGAQIIITQLPKAVSGLLVEPS